MNKKALILALTILLAGVIWKLYLTSNGNFIFNMDNGRDMVDVREMVILKNLRLIGPRTPIEGVFDGPAWYYLLSIPFIISGGDPYATIILQIILWAIGGFFLLKLVSRWGDFLILPIGLVWIFSNFINLQTMYAFNPNPVTFLTPLLIYLIYKYIETNRLIFSTSAFFLGGLFFNFEMNYGVFIPLIILINIILLNKNLLKFKNFWIGSLFFILCLLPQVLFDLKNNFIMSKALINHFLNPNDYAISISRHLDTISSKFFDVFVSSMMDNRIFSLILLLLFVPVIFKFIKDRKKDVIVMIALTFVIVPFIIFTLISSISVNPWHLGGSMAAAIILTGFLFKELWRFNITGKIMSGALLSYLVFFSISNIFKFYTFEKNIPNMDPSRFKNEIAVIDFIYQYANGKNFKVYTYLPSVYDYPYQYLIWWYGFKKYGYLPEDYAYLPNVPQYISNKEKFSATDEQLKQRDDSNLVFLIKEPLTKEYTLYGWEGNFIKLQSLVKQTVGPLEIEIKKETTQ